MERMTGAANFNNLEKDPLLPPQTSYSRNNVTPVSEDCGPSGSKEEPCFRKELINDQPASPESNSMEEHFSWLIDFLALDGPDMPVEIYAHRHSFNDIYDSRLHSNTHLQTDSKQVQQQIPQRSQVQKLQYISELENYIQALHAQHLEVLAQLQYVAKQNFILNNENEVLKQRLNYMLHEQHIKCVQNDMLRRELHHLHQLLQQQRPPQPFTIPRSH